MATEYIPCDLCSLPVETPGFELMTHSGLKRFCCEGSVGVYEMLHGDELVFDESGDAPNQGASGPNS
jgi:hypothetical protein